MFRKIDGDKSFLKMIGSKLGRSSRNKIATRFSCGFFALIFSLSNVQGDQNDKNSQSGWPTEKGRQQVKSLMHQFWTHFEALRNYMGDTDKFKDPNNAEKINGHLKELARLTKKSRHESELSKPNLTFSRKILEEHLSEMERVFRAGNRDYARWMLNSTATICMSCHTQFPTDPGAQSLPDVGVGTTFSDAEFLFATRRYDSAANIYRKLIGEYNSSKIKVNELETSIRRLVAIHARIRREPRAGLKELETILKNKNLPDYIRKDTEAWKALFEKWKTEGDIDPKTVGEDELKAWVEKQFEQTLWDRMVPATDPRTVTYLRVSGVLYEYLQLHANSNIKAQILYWLARCEYRLNNNFFYSLGDLYLKECMDSFAKKPIAKKCFFEYEDNMIMSYTGSRGTYFPKDVADSLRELRAKVGLRPGQISEE